MAEIILGHLLIAEKSNEIPATQDMIATLGLTGRLFTLDAMHAPKKHYVDGRGEARLFGPSIGRSCTHVRCG
ncbi:MAG: hypothetical protein P4L90_07430 [Rhodopila sp.]|nr:hypothetical protein [Rhodopila sp.]